MDWNFTSLRRSADDQIIAGICGGLGQYTPVPALIWRLVFVLSLLAGGAGLLVYALMWWLMPTSSSTGAEAGATWNLHALRRSDTDHQLGGVCSGLAEFTPVPAWIWRVAFVALVFAGGIGVAAYLLLWLLLPKTEIATSGA